MIGWEEASRDQQCVKSPRFLERNHRVCDALIFTLARQLFRRCFALTSSKPTIISKNSIDLYREVYSAKVKCLVGYVWIKKNE
jgi:hypothetical protein